MNKNKLARKIVRSVRESIGNILWKYFSDKIFSKDSHTVLMLHRVIPDDINVIGDQHLCITAKKLQETIDIIRTKFTLHDIYKKPDHLSNRRLSITFDDGWQDNYHIAKHYFIKNEIPFTIFLTTGLIGTNKNLWFHALDLLFNSAEHVKIMAFFKNTLPESDNITNTSDIINALKKLPFHQIDKIIENAEKEFATEIQYSPKSTILNWAQVTELAEAGATFGSHGIRHAIMPALNRTEKIYEAEESWKILSKKVKSFIPVYSYPNGLYSRECIEICKKAGYKFGLSANLQMQQYDESFKIIPRISIGELMSVNLIKYRICLAHIKKKTG